jgi:hypothetical protein
MKDVYAECEKKHGKAIDLAVKRRNRTGEAREVVELAGP